VLHRLREAVEEDRLEYGSSHVTNPALHPKAQLVRQRVALHVQEIYGEEDVDEITDELMDAANMSESSQPIALGTSKWDQTDVMMITYGDSLLREGRAPLRELYNFTVRELKETISGVHILPFNPYSSDDGFSVIDYTAVNPKPWNLGGHHRARTRVRPHGRPRD
jgi:sucrose phosphorylase